MPDNSIENFADLVAEVDTLRTNTEASFTQVNQSLISFSEKTTDYIKLQIVIAAEQGATINANVNAYPSFSWSIPSGYKTLGIMASIVENGCIWWSQAVILSPTATTSTSQLAIKNISGVPITLNQLKAIVIFIKE